MVPVKMYVPFMQLKAVTGLNENNFAKIIKRKYYERKYYLKALSFCDFFAFLP